MSFGDDIRRFQRKLDAANKELFVTVANATKDSIVIGSPVTGAPGQPVDTGALRASWQLRFLSPVESEISTNLAYAPAIEDGVGPHGPLTLRSSVGGFHSVKATVAGFGRIVEDETIKLGSRS